MVNLIPGVYPTRDLDSLYRFAIFAKQASSKGLRDSGVGAAIGRPQTGSTVRPYGRERISNGL